MNQTSSPQTPTRPASAGIPVRTDVRAGECVRYGDVMVCR